ncbi:DUF3817 domain-containing protein [Demequina aurantiaca]|uniref:DUF3817 domain-containing protein n=1 Tax=Demequina aurantiaca TaxID=676200 RepID=UPI0007854E1B|nr:DUF3817 domain-containing protein [Demequina aurantiaca]
MSDATQARAGKIRGALKRYQVMAIITSSFLLLLTIVTLVKYIGDWAFDWVNEGFLSVALTIGIVHGWIYVVYLLTCLDLWTKMKWSFGRLVYMALGGVIPVLGFFVEAKLARDVKNGLES